MFTSEGIETILTPYRCGEANVFAERWVRTVREECLDRLLILGEGHLVRVLQEYVGYYNDGRPHKGSASVFQCHCCQREQQRGVLFVVETC